MSMINEKGVIMSKKILKQLNRNIRNLRPKLSTDEVCQIFEEKDLLEIGFLSKCCRNDLNGSCIMCDYGCASGIREYSKYLSEMKYILDNRNSNTKCLLLCTNGSFFDESQIPLPLFKDIVMLTSEYSIPTIEFETHYIDVSSQKLNMIRKILPDKHIIIEMGLESVNQVYQENVIMKNIDLSSYEKTIYLIQKYGFEVETNIMVGFPFLDSNEQLKDAFNSVMWALSHKCGVVLFPINIKPYTVLMQMYKKGLYSPISHWLLILLLDSIPIDELGKITIAWYGNREERYSDTELLTIFPAACPQCRKKIMLFYSNFLEETNCKKRKDLIGQLIESCKCACLKNQINLLNQSNAESFETRYFHFCNILKNEFIDKENFCV